MSYIEIITICFIILVLFLPFIFDYIKYKKSAYYKITKNSYGLLLINKGLKGEYLIYKQLKHFEDIGAKFLFNLYIPTYKNKTTEIDVVMICRFGIFVFESKNYSGWIFGKENQKYWTQSLHIGYGRTKKEHFYNPIWQNETHVKYLQRIFGKNIPINSIVVFSNSCELKSIYNNSDTIITYVCYLNEIVENMFDKVNTNILNNEKVQILYENLYPYTQVTNDVKREHIKNMYK